MINICYFYTYIFNLNGLLQLGGTIYSSGGSSSSIWSPAITESNSTFPGDHQRLAWTTTASQQQCYQNYSSYYSNMDYLSPAPHQLNVVVSNELLLKIIFHIMNYFFITIIYYVNFYFYFL